MNSFFEEEHIYAEKNSSVKRTRKNPLKIGNKKKQRSRENFFNTEGSKERRKASKLKRSSREEEAKLKDPTDKAKVSNLRKVAAKQTRDITLSKIESIESLEEEEEFNAYVENKYEEEYSIANKELYDVLSMFEPCWCCGSVICDYLDESAAIFRIMKLNRKKWKQF